MAQRTSLNMEAEFAGLDFHSLRLEERFIRTMETLCKQPDKSIREASEDRAEAKAIYRMPENENFDRDEILRAHQKATIRRMAGYGGTILAVQDTTGVNYNTHLKTDGIGYISDKTLGVNIHICLAVTCDGLVLGVLGQSCYNRKEHKDESADRDSRKVRPIEEKESFRWRGLKSDETLERSTADLSLDMKVITVCDREGDIYELFARAQSLRVPLLVRIVRNRMTMENKRILDEIRKERYRGRVEVIISRDSRSGIPEREAVLQMRYASYPVKRPHTLNPVKNIAGLYRYAGYLCEGRKAACGEGTGRMVAETSFPMTTGESVSGPEEAYEYAG